ncbi:uncharacterized protein LOC115440960 isoform X2 [Manduca sexta]|uniref:Chitin-binding type-2 domain-containing protein n=1 Tax=Manduca sexta TaxID=7130 RepID=A0A921YKI7_MANSE|nr:uncharacterized protein LOC115440960 isoform X2 [Manduca sexta]KAG6440845.1 hypothetical protein O3G_MSEX001481 [Manduca sexta]
MGYRDLLLVCATVLYLYSFVVATQGGTLGLKIPPTSFTCQGRAAGYYADLETGCQVYHMCDGLGRQFSYTCPNTTLFQQRMLICDHWYMVNCSMSERDYNANLLIGQRDKPFVSDEEMRLRTPRPDILSVPLNNNYYDGLKEAEAKFPLHPGNSIVGVADTISDEDDNGLDSGKRNYRPPTSWSMRNRRPNVAINVNDIDSIAGAASQDPGPTIRPVTKVQDIPVYAGVPITVPSKELSPPLLPTTTEAVSEEDLPTTTDVVYNFIRRFDPNSPDSLKTAISKSEILDLNKHLPEGQVSSEDERTPRKNKNFDKNLNNFHSDNDKSFTERTRFDTVNIKSNPTESVTTVPQVPTPDRVLLPPKTDYAPLPSTTMGPPIYYEWKWAVPAFELELPKEGNITNSTNTQRTRSIGKSPFSTVTRYTIPDEDATPKPRDVEYNISSYFVPDYVFPLDKSHPGYEDDDAQTSFQVQVSRPGRSSYGENPECPQCHPAYLKAGTCEPCIVKR